MIKVIKSQSDLRYLSLQFSKIAVCTAAILVRQSFVVLPSIDRLRLLNLSSEISNQCAYLKSWILKEKSCIKFRCKLDHTHTKIIWR